MFTGPFELLISSKAVPTFTSVLPNLSCTGIQDFSIRVSGSNFVDGSAVTWDGMALETTFLNAGELFASVSPALLFAPGQVSVAVLNPDGAVSASGPFEVMASAVISVEPASTAAANIDLPLAVVGSCFTLNSSITWNEVDQPTLVISPDRLEATIPGILRSAAGQQRHSLERRGANSVGRKLADREPAVGFEQSPRLTGEPESSADRSRGESERFGRRDLLRTDNRGV